jgi:hypothetical protein
MMAALFLLLATGAFPQGSTNGMGSVQGIVLDGDGNPLPGARVSAHPFTDMVNSRIYTDTDEAGRFDLRGIPAGGVYLRAFKESDGYPYNNFAFYIMPGEVMPQIHIDPGETVKGVVIQLGARAAHLNIQLTDSDGVPLKQGGGLVFDRLDQPGPTGRYERSSHAQESLLVPPVAFRLTVEVKGYEAWHYGGKHWREDAGIISLKSGESLALIVRLKPSR